MNISEMHIGVKLGLDKTSSLELPSFLDEELDYWINVAIQAFVNERINVIRHKSIQSNVDISTKLVDAYEGIRTLIKNSPVIDNVTGTLPTDLYSLLEVYAYVDRLLEDGTSVGSTEYQCKLISEAESFRYKETNGHKPYFLYPVYYVNSYNSHYLKVLVDSFSTLLEVKVSYVKNPAVVSLSSTVDCDLPEFTHQKIVDLTVILLLENIESQRFATNSVILKNKD